MPIKPLRHNDLSKFDALQLVELGYAAAFCNTQEHLHHLLGSLKKIFPVDALVCGTGRIDGISSIDDVWASSDIPIIKLGLICRYDWPAEFLSTYFKANMIRRDAQLYGWFRTFRPQLWIELYEKQRHPFNPYTKRGFDPLFVEMIFDYKLDHSVRFGHLDSPESITGLVANFRTRREALQYSELLQTFFPYLHHAVSRAYGMNRVGKSPPGLLTLREREVLTRLVQGNSDWEIGMCLHISERTVKFHVQNLMRKLEAVNRPHLIANTLGKIN